MNKLKYDYAEIDLTKATDDLINDSTPQPNIPEKRNLPRTAWKPGQSGNPKGPKKGIVHKNTIQIRNFLMLIMEKNLPKLQEDLNKMSPFNRWQILEKLSRSFLPSLTATKIDQTVDGEIKIHVKFETTEKRVQNNNDIEDANVVD